MKRCQYQPCEDRGEPSELPYGKVVLCEIHHDLVMLMMDYDSRELVDS